MQWLIILLALAFVAYGDGAALGTAANERIVGGRTVDISVHPHQVSLLYKGLFTPERAYSHRCGGSIYDEYTIVTAAHCVIATVASQFQINAGSNFFNGMDGAVLPVKEIVMHERFNPGTYDNDVALLFLEVPLPLNNFTIKPIELSDDEPNERSMATVTGWGAIAWQGPASRTLQEVKVPIVSNEQCNEDYGGSIKESMLCAGVRGVGGKDACQGDSGGPLVINGKLAGIVSWGNACALPNYPGVYAKVSYLLPWILEKIHEHHHEAGLLE